MAVGAEEVRAQIGRLAGSKTFETSEVHRRLLHYLAEKTLSGEADRLKEYTVGVEAFSKPPSYDPRFDSIVRLQSGRLRQKLMAYYQTEASGDEVLVSLPKGGFKLSFEPMPAHVPGHAEALRAKRRMYALIGALSLLALWAVVATAAWIRSHNQLAPVASQWTPELEELWAPFLQSNRSLLVCLGTPLFVRFPNYGFFRDPKANDWPEIGKSERIQTFLRDLKIPEKDIWPSYGFTGAGEASAGFMFARLLSTRKPELQLTRSSILSWQQITDQDVIFIGPPKFNQQLQAAALTQDIVIEPEGIRNLKPRPGEPEFLKDNILAGRPSEGQTHALISLTRGISGVGELLVIAGNGSPDTQAAAEYLTRPNKARDLVGHLRGPSGKLPRYYEAVIKVDFKQGIPVESSYVFHHALEEPAKPSIGR